MECKGIYYSGDNRTGDGFNRNIVECKVWIPSSFVFQLNSFNRNIVECKDTHPVHLPAHPPVLIETLWNVKFTIADGTPNNLQF